MPNTYKGIPDFRSALEDSRRSGGCLYKMVILMMLSLCGLGCLGVVVSWVQSGADKMGMGTHTSATMWMVDASEPNTCIVSTESAHPDIVKHPAATQYLTSTSKDVLAKCKKNIGRKVKLKTDLTGEEIRDVIPVSR